MKICGIYRITNTITGDFYIGSSNNVKRRWREHKCKSTWKKYPNYPMYLDMKKYGIDKFVFEILEEVETDKLKETEQEFIELLKPTYNNINAKGLNIERLKEYKKSDKYKEYKKEYNKKYQKEYEKSDKRKEYEKTDKRKESHRKANKKYDNQLCCFNGEMLTLCALASRFRKAGIPHPSAEAKKYLLQ